jgi:sulfur carrier protein ThiS adenylyltransferase
MFDFSSVAKKYYTKEQYAAVRGAHIGIAGAGGLGSNCAVCLARSGFERFTIVDFDVVEESNLNRQTYNYRHIGKPKVECLNEVLRDINPAIVVDRRQLKLNEENIVNVYKNCDVIIEAFDKADCKAMLARAFLPLGKFIVSVSGIGGTGNADAIKTRKVKRNYFLIGDGVSGVGADVKPYAPRVVVAAAKQADVVLSWVLGRTK